MIAAVLLYRIVSAWALVPVGWGLWRTMPKAHLERLEPAAGTGLTTARMPRLPTFYGVEGRVSLQSRMSFRSAKYQEPSILANVSR